AVAWLLAFVIVYGLVRPLVGQTYFFELAVCVGVMWAGVGWLLQTWRPEVHITFPIALLGLNLLLLLIAVARSRNPEYAFGDALLPIAFSAFCLLLIMQPRRRVLLRRMGLGLYIVGPLLAIYGILQYFGFEFLPY